MMGGPGGPDSGDSRDFGDGMTQPPRPSPTDFPPNSGKLSFHYIRGNNVKKITYFVLAMSKLGSKVRFVFSPRNNG
jgi:hypothetical protein